MAFVFDQTSRAAVDTERDISVKKTNDFLDAGTTFKYQFDGLGLSFTFEATALNETRTFMERGVETQRFISVGYDVIEPSVKPCVEAAAKTMPQINYQTVKNAIMDAFFVLGQRGVPPGTVPDFKVAFYDFVFDVNKFKKLIQPGA